MALNGTLGSVNFTGSQTKMRADWTAVQSIENNTSTITVRVYLDYQTSGTIGFGSRKGTITIHGVSYSFETSTVQVSGSGTKLVATRTGSPVPHDAEGKQSAAISVSWAVNLNMTSGYTGTLTLSGTAALTTIPRRSGLTVHDGVLGEEQRLVIDRKSGSFTDTVSYTCGAVSGVLAQQTSGTELVFTPPLELAGQNTEGTEVEVVYTITTYNGAASLGSSTVKAVYTIPESVVPGCTAALSDPTGRESVWGGYVQNASRLAVILTPESAYGAEIVSFRAEVNGSVYTEEVFETDFLKTAGLNVLSVAVTDSRGRVGRTEAVFSVLEYARPRVCAWTEQEPVARRSDAGGQADLRGAYLYINAGRACSKVSAEHPNGCRLEYRIRGSGSYGDWITLLEADSEAEGADYISSQPILEQTAYRVQLQATDDMGFAHTYEVPVSASELPLHLAKDGLSFGLGQFAVSGKGKRGDFGWPVWFNAGIGRKRIFEGDTPWNGGSLRSAFPEADTEGLTGYTLFLALTGEGRQPLLCAGAGGVILGGALQTAITEADGVLDLAAPGEGAPDVYALYALL